ncbi:MAG TPA: M28 family peptidase [Ohtaekwangia sp.]
MRILSILSIVFVTISISHAQKKVISNIRETVTAHETETHLRFLAADEMRGRDTGSPEIDIAANYIATQFRLLGIKPAAGTTSYFQDVQLEKISPPAGAEFVLGNETFKLKDDLLLMSGSGTSLEGEVVFIGYGTPDDFNKQDVKGKIVVTFAGTSATTNPVQALLTDSPEKNKIAARHGVLALVEVMALPGVPWPALVNYLSTERMVTKKENVNSFPHLWMKNSEAAGLKTLLEQKRSTGKISLTANPPKAIKAKNVAAVIAGTDASLKKQWIVLSAHYDHVGVKKNAAGTDSIFNGARDNAIGTVAVLEAAKFFSKNPPKRSVLLLALTAEEKGLLGSEWYSNHPLIPLKETVLDFNCDGAGYNDTTIASVIDLNRITTDEQLSRACQAFGLILKGDPVPEQNLYERSDNLNFAVKGVPAINFSPGVKSFDQELFKYYHQPADEVNSLNMHYLGKFYQAFVYAAYLFANEPPIPTWKKGDKFEEAGIKLYFGK